MGLYKELNHALLEVANKYHCRNYSTYKVPVDGPHDALCKEIRDILTDPDLMCSLRIHRTEKRTTSSLKVEVVIYLPWEREGTSVSCTRWDILYEAQIIDNYKTHYVTLFNTHAYTSDSNIWVDS